MFETGHVYRAEPRASSALTEYSLDSGSAIDGANVIELRGNSDVDVRAAECEQSALLRVRRRALRR